MTLDSAALLFLVVQAIYVNVQLARHFRSHHQEAIAEAIKERPHISTVTMPDYDPHCPSMLHTYGEAGARGVLTRARLRGEERFMFYCPWADHWHVTDKPLADFLDVPHIDGEA